jgi:hypothetical protein
MAARKNKGDIKLNKKHNGKEFTSSFHFVGLVKPVRKKEEDSDNWYDVEIFDTNKTSTNKDRRVLQFNVETAFKNELKVELAGMEMPLANVYSSKNKHNFKIDWADRFNKSLYPDETYHLIDPDWDKAEKFSKQIKEGMWVEVKGHYEFSSFTNNDGDEINIVKRTIDQVYPLKNGEVEIKAKDGDTFKAYDAAEDGQYIGMGKAKDGVTTVRVGWLNPEGGKLYICKVESDGTEGKRTELTYTDGSVQVSDRIKVTNNVDSQIRLPKGNGQAGFEYVPYVRNFKDENFKEINSFEMQLGIRSTYQDENSKDTKVNGVFLDYGKEKSEPRDVELTVYYKEAEEGKTALADAFARLNRLDFFVVEGVDNNRAEFAMVEVQETEEDDNPFEDVGEKVTDYEQVSTGTKKGLEILRYISGTYKKEFLTDEEISKETSENGDPFENVTINDDDLPF